MLRVARGRVPRVALLAVLCRRRRTPIAADRSIPPSSLPRRRSRPRARRGGGYLRALGRSCRGLASAFASDASTCCSIATVAAMVRARGRQPGDVYQAAGGWLGKESVSRRRQSRTPVLRRRFLTQSWTTSPFPLTTWHGDAVNPARRSRRRRAGAFFRRATARRRDRPRHRASRNVVVPDASGRTCMDGGACPLCAMALVPIPPPRMGEFKLDVELLGSRWRRIGTDAGGP